MKHKYSRNFHVFQSQNKDRLKETSDTKTSKSGKKEHTHKKSDESSR